MRARRLTLVVVSILAVVVVAAVLVVGAGSHHRTATTRPGVVRQHHPHPATSLPRSTRGVTWRRQPIPTPPAVTPIEQTINAKLSGAMTTALVGFLATGFPPPAPSYTGGWTAVVQSTTPGTYAENYVIQLLSIDFAHQSRTGLMHWLSANQARYDLPGLGTNARLGALFAYANGGPTFTAPGLKRNVKQHSPIPTSGQWVADAAAGTVWRVNNAFASTLPSWTKILSTGWAPLDPKMSIQTVSGTLTATTAGHSTTTHFSLAVVVGSGVWLPGYGTSLFTSNAVG